MRANQKTTPSPATGAKATGRKRKAAKPKRQVASRSKGAVKSQQESGTAIPTEKKPFGRPREWTLEKVMAEGEALLNWFKEDDTRYWLKNFALERGYDPSLFSDWCEMYPRDFPPIFAQAKQIQEARLIDAGMFRARNGSIVEMALTNFHNWRKQPETIIDNRQVTIGLDETQALEYLKRRGEVILPDQRQKLLAPPPADYDPGEDE